MTARTPFGLKRLSWVDDDGNEARIHAGMWGRKDAGVLATLAIYSPDGSEEAVFIDAYDARCLHAWLEVHLEQVSSTQEGIPHTDVPVKNDTK